jgi:uncharacterized membrane protein
MSHPKKDFQVERIILFSDAVFAIAITLLAIEIRIPEFDDHTERNAVISLINLIPRFIGFFISFMIIGIYWISHHSLFGYVVDYDKKLLWRNLFFLLFIVLLPFSTGFYSQYGYLRTPLLLYSMNILLLGLTLIGILNHISDPSKKLSKGLENPLLIRYIRWRSVIVGSTFLLITFIQYLLPDHLLKYTRFLFFLIFLWMVVLRKIFTKKGLDVKNY